MERNDAGIDNGAGDGQGDANEFSGSASTSQQSGASARAARAARTPDLISPARVDRATNTESAIAPRTPSARPVKSWST